MVIKGKSTTTRRPLKRGAGGYPFSLTTASKRESIVFYTIGQVSWLVILLPSFSFRLDGIMDLTGNNFLYYLQLRDSPRFTHGSFLIPALHRQETILLKKSKELYYNKYRL